MDFMFVVNSILLGIGLAMDAFSVSLANGLADPSMKKGKMGLIAGCFAFFQWFMPMLGWLCVHTLVQYFARFQPLIPWIALALLLFIGGKMLIEGIKGGEESQVSRLTIPVLLLQGLATSIDALSVGFTIADYGTLMALTSTIIIAITTFLICMAGLVIGKKVGTKLSGKAQILGGVILILIGIEIFVKGVFF